jgi:hypothetical protein
MQCHASTSTSAKGPVSFPMRRVWSSPTLMRRNARRCRRLRIGQDLLSKGNAHKVIVEVRNPRGKRVLAVTVTMQVERVAPRA